MPRIGVGEKVNDVESSSFSHCLSQTKKVYEKKYFIFGVLLVVAIVALILCTNIYITSPMVKSECSTPECVSTSSRTREFMDFNVDPCSDFYSFACGGLIADGKSVLNSYFEIKNKVEDQIRTILNETISENDLASVKLVKRMYQQCMTPENHSLARFEWPTAQGRSENVLDRSWTKIIAEFRKVGHETNSILSVFAFPNPKNQSSNIIVISPPVFELKPEELLDELNNNVYSMYTLPVARMNGPKFGRVKPMLKLSLEFESKLAQISESTDFEDSNSTDKGENNLFTLRSLQRKFPYIQWVDYINALLPSSVSIDEDEVVWVPNLSYFTALEAFLNDTPADVIQTYLIWSANREQIKYYYIANEYVCADFIQKNFLLPVSSIYIQKHFNQSASEPISKMVEVIRNELKLILKESSWMDESTRKRSAEKLNEMFVNIAYPEYVMNVSGIEKFYDGLKIDERNFLSSILSMNKLNIDKLFAFFREPNQRNEWDFKLPPHSANAGYLRIRNGLQIPAGILQGNFFSSERPWYMNFGAIGSVIGHEFTHGFDSVDELGSRLDSHTRTMFSKHEKCFGNQYGHFKESMTGPYVNGTRTLRDNIADNGGFKLSYLAYQKWERENGVEPKLPGLDYTSQQMFWISAAQMYCSTAKRQYNEVMEDEHSPDRFRVIGSFRNSKEFAKDFKCPVGSPMNPIEKCEYW